MLLVASYSTIIPSGAKVVYAAEPTVKDPVGALEEDTVKVKVSESVTVIWCVPWCPVVAPPANAPFTIFTICPVPSLCAAEVLTVITLPETVAEAIPTAAIVCVICSSTWNTPELDVSFTAKVCLADDPVKLEVVPYEKGLRTIPSCLKSFTTEKSKASVCASFTSVKQKCPPSSFAGFEPCPPSGPMITSNAGAVPEKVNTPECCISCCSLISSGRTAPWVYPEPSEVTVQVVIVPSRVPSVPPIITEHNAPVPSPRTGTFTTVLLAATFQALPPTKESPAVVILIISNPPSALALPDSAPVKTGIKSGVKKFCTWVVVNVNIYLIV